MWTARWSCFFELLSKKNQNIKKVSTTYKSNIRIQMYTCALFFFLMIILAVCVCVWVRLCFSVYKKVVLCGFGYFYELMCVYSYVHVCIFMNWWVCEDVHASVSAAWWTICQLRLTWCWVATPRGCAGLRGRLSLISSIRPPCVMAADPRRSIGRDGRPVLGTNDARFWAHFLPGAALTLLLSNSKWRWERWHFG